MDYTFGVQGRVCPGTVVIQWLSVATAVAPGHWVAGIETRLRTLHELFS